MGISAIHAFRYHFTEDKLVMKKSIVINFLNIGGYFPLIGIITALMRRSIANSHIFLNTNLLVEH